MTNVLIVGAGPTGLTLACELARRGVDVRVIDAGTAHHRDSRGKTLQPRSLEVLEDLGVVDRILEAGVTHLAFRKYFNGQHVSDADPFDGDGPTPDAPYDSGVFIGQWRIEEILRDKLAEHGVTVELGTELIDFTQDDDHVVATTSGGQRIGADYLVGCDGGRSTVRKLLGVRFDGHTEQVQAMVCGDVEADGITRDAWHQWFTPEGAIMLCPLPGTNAFQLQATPELDDRGEPLPPSLDSFQRLFDRHARVPGVQLSRPTWLSTWRVNVRMAEHFRVGRVFLAGDAAHVHPIAGGLGMNTGIQDAYNLGWKLALVAAGQAGPGLLDTYEEERLPVAAWTLEITTDRLRHVLEAIKEPGAGVEAAATPAIGRGYRWSSLSAATGAGDPAVLCAGDRAPDAPCIDSAGEPVRLFQLYAGPRFTLLGFGPGSAQALRDVTAKHQGLVQAYAVDGDEPGLRDRDGHARRAYGMTDDALVLIRPDNHVALVAPARETAAVLTYLDGLHRGYKAETRMAVFDDGGRKSSQ
ncbi:FAD-dependent oxidoreductase [Nonomuraea sp. NPDC026600]|uniref:FAD-dependent oxidoreductase n=1 Tax=Nonomuraea sp. NPDC026600 TaxID=3155363 RepID=UPI00340F2193